MRDLVVIALVLAGCSFQPSVAPREDAALTSDGVVDATRDADVDGTPAISDAPPVMVSCPGSMCGEICCEGTCTDIVASVCAGKSYRCDGPEDCGTDEVCCNDANGSFCTTAPCNGGNRYEVCHSTSDCSFSCNDCSFHSDFGQKLCCE